MRLWEYLAETGKLFVLKFNFCMDFGVKEKEFAEEMRNQAEKQLKDDEQLGLDNNKRKNISNP